MTEPGLNMEEAQVVAKGIATPLFQIVHDLVQARLRHAQEILYGTPSDRDEHIAIGMSKAYQGLLDELEGAPERAEAEARRQAAKSGTSPEGTVYG